MRTFTRSGYSTLYQHASSVLCISAQVSLCSAAQVSLVLSAADRYDPAGLGASYTGDEPATYR